MSRKRVTQVFPFLLPIRKWQRKKLFYLKMYFDKNRYAKETSNKLLEYHVFDTSFLMLNENSGVPLQCRAGDDQEGIVQPPGFHDTDIEQVVNGLRFTPMEL